MDFSEILKGVRSRLVRQTRAFRWRYLTTLREGEEYDFVSLDYIEGVSATSLLEGFFRNGTIGLIHSMNPRESRLHQAHHSFLKLYRNQKALQETLGSHVLYLGYPFVRGCLGDGTTISTPLYLIPVRLFYQPREFPRWILKRIGHPDWNHLFLLLYNQVYSVVEGDKIHLPPITIQKETLAAFLVSLRKTLLAHHIELRFPSEIFQTPLKSFRGKGDEEMKPGELEVLPYAVIGFFYHPWTTFLNAYDEIANQLDYYKQRFSRLIQARRDRDQKEGFFLPYQFHPLDHSQIEVLDHFFSQGSIVVEGPPGTGKSMTIAHVIVNVIWKKQSVLFIAEKWTSLKVVYQFLTEAGIPFVPPPIRDLEEDRPQLFRHILLLMDKVEFLEEQEAKAYLSAFQDFTYRIQIACEPYEKAIQILFQQTFVKETPFTLYSLLNKELAQWNVRKYASLVDKYRLEAIIAKIRRIEPYKHLLNSDHPWYDRKDWSSYSLADVPKVESFLKEKLPSLLEKRNQLKRQLVVSVDGHEYDFSLLSLQELKSCWEVYKRSIYPYMQEEPIPSLIVSYQKSDFQKYWIQVCQMSEVVLQIKEVNLRKWEQVLEAEKWFSELETFEGRYYRFFHPYYYKLRRHFKKTIEELGISFQKQDFLKRLFFKVRQLKRMMEEMRGCALSSFFPVEAPLDVLEQREKMEEAGAKIKVLLTTPWHKEWVPGIRNGHFSLSQWEEDVQTIQRLQELRAELEKVESEIAHYLSEKQIQKLEASPSFYSALVDSFQSDAVALLELDKNLETWDVTEKAIFQLIQCHISKEDFDWEQSLRHSFYLAWIEEIEKTHPELRYFSTEQIHSFCTMLKSLMEQWMGMSGKATFYQWALNLKPYVSSPLWLQLKKDLSRKRNRNSVKTLLETYRELFGFFFQVVLTVPETGLKLFGLKAEFDVLIFDEASQLPLETTFPCLFQGKRWMVCGDKHQLPPSRLFTPSSHLEESNLEDSLLDFVSTLVPSKRLLWHYRSQHSALIAFSNQHFYQNQLLVLPFPHSVPPSSVFFYHQVNGKWIEQTNLEEGKKVIKLLQFYYEQDPVPGIAVITFNYAQQQLIESLVDQWLETLPSKLYQKVYPYIVGDHEKSLLIRNIEGIQGEERDIVIFSIGYGPREDGSFPAHFGLLNYEGGENRLNVAITRAKKAVHIVASFSPQQLKVEETKHRGPRLLKSYLLYVYELANETSAFQEEERCLSSDPFSLWREDPFFQKVHALLEANAYRLDSGSRTFFPYYYKGNEMILIEGKKLASLRYGLGKYFHLPWFMEKRGWKPRIIHFRSIALEGIEAVRKIVGQ